MITSQDVLEYVREHGVTGDVREHFASVISFMFQRELCQAQLWPPLNGQEILELERRNKLEAVKLYKRRNGCGLIDAKNRIEEFMMIHYKVTTFNHLNLEDEDE